ncbi:hypothetical protein GQ607_016971, partial [Colletotrichum asianum]
LDFYSSLVINFLVFFLKILSAYLYYKLLIKSKTNYFNL